MMHKYILDGHKAIVVEDVLEWGQWFEKADRHVACTDIGVPYWKYWLGKLLRKKWESIRISTVFLGIDHSWNSDIPMLFETMVFGGKLDGEQERYATWEDAEAGHIEMVHKVEVSR